jgi:hypothetical protein
MNKRLELILNDLGKIQIDWFRTCVSWFWNGCMAFVVGMFTRSWMEYLAITYMKN